MIETVCSPSPDLLSSGVTHPDRMNDLIGYGLESCQPPAFSHNGKPLKGFTNRTFTTITTALPAGGQPGGQRTDSGGFTRSQLQIVPEMESISLHSTDPVIHYQLDTRAFDESSRAFFSSS
jgi:hypothetical protein